MGEIKVVELTQTDVCWPFERPPFVYLPGGAWKRQEVIDPFPCYSHDAGYVRELSERVKALWPVSFEVNFVVMPYEGPSRTNGWMHLDNERYDKDAGKYVGHVGTIVLPGKRIPLHPAMTRYLVAHEYGHAVEDDICIKRGLDPNQRGILEEYRDMRQVPASPAHYGGGTWHLNVGEIFANDFRLLICGAEMDYWPHLDVPRPETVPAVCDWWEKERAALLVAA